MNRFFIALTLICCSSLADSRADARKEARGAGKESDKALTLEDAITEAEKALDRGAAGEASSIAERLHRTHGLSKDEQRRLDLIDARCDLAQGSYEGSEKLLAKLHKLSPEDARITEWYGRALEGTGKSDGALEVLSQLAAKDELAEGDSYWTLAQLERKAGKNGVALAHAKQALKRPIVLQSDELDKEIHKFIVELDPKGR